MEKNQLSNYIANWNVKYPFDKKWRNKHRVPLFSEVHKNMCLVDIWMECEEDRLYDEAKDNFIKEKKLEEEGLVSLRDQKYIRGAGNWLKPSEDNMTEEEQEDLFNKIKI